MLRSANTPEFRAVLKRPCVQPDGLADFVYLNWSAHRRKSHVSGVWHFSPQDFAADYLLHGVHMVCDPSGAARLHLPSLPEELEHEERRLPQKYGETRTAARAAFATELMRDPVPELGKVVGGLALKISRQRRLMPSPAPGGLKADVKEVEKALRLARAKVTSFRWKYRRHQELMLRFPVTGVSTHLLRQDIQELDARGAAMDLSNTDTRPTAEQLCAKAVVSLHELVHWLRPQSADPRAWTLCELLWIGSGGSPTQRKDGELGRWERHIRWVQAELGLIEFDPERDNPKAAVGAAPPDEAATKLIPRISHLVAGLMVDDAIERAGFVALPKPVALPKRRLHLSKWDNLSR